MPTFDARDLNLGLDKTMLKTLYKTQSHKHAWAIVLNWLIILLTIFLCIQFFHPLLYAFTIIVVGARMHALAILMHDASHYRFLKNKKLNDRVTNFTFMYFIFSSIETYRQNHLKHHMHLNTEHDPDWVAKLGKREFVFPKTKREFVLTVLSYFLLYQGIMDAIWFLKRFAGSDKTSKKKKKTSLKEKLPRIVFYVALAIVLSVTGTWAYLGLYWVIPYLSTFFMFQYIRSVAEHFGDLAYDHLLNATRSVKVNFLESFFIAPHQVGYHIEHHLYPGVPFYNLPILHKELMALPEYREKAHITMGYTRGLLNDLGDLG